uniref:tRNA (cytosine(38)-C(5))-methyltransferase n=1 Tax=Lygus hesperus TaxID=30085 RepID=A0A146M5P9_LYGHE
MGVNTILMSPPCQPFTRVGNKKDLDDKRCVPLAHILSILKELVHLQYILVENVTGFETSEAGECLRGAVTAAGFEFREMMISPLQLGIPNSRERYYMVAVKKPLQFTLDIPARDELDDKAVRNIMRKVSNRKTPSCISDILDLPDDSSEYNQFLVSDDVLRKRAWILDIATKTSTKTCCYTKSYTHYIEGTGSVYCPYDEKFIENTYETAKTLERDSSEYLTCLKTLRLRFFTPKEVQRTLCFPDSFTYPPEITRKQKYRLLGNSINVEVVSRLIRIMTNYTET